MNNKISTKIAVIGAGVSGLTCAYLLRKKGFEITVYSKNSHSVEHLYPDFSSLYPAASIIPHSVDHPELNSLFKISQVFFSNLHINKFPGVTRHSHYELFAKEYELESYAPLIDGFRVLSEKELNSVPCHPSFQTINGWKFNCLFTEWQLYFPELLKRCKETGINFIYSEIQNNEIDNMPYDYIINCAEIGGPALAGEDFEPVIYRGHLLFVPDKEMVNDTDGKPVSYNFLPGKNIYQSEDGSEIDVYFYPRKDGWVLGGSRQKGTIDKSGNWIGETTTDPFLDIDGIKIPEQILSLNSEIIAHSFGRKLSSLKGIKAKLGYRFMGNKKPGLRLDSVQSGSKCVINNYGHGGAGVTLSWACAVETLYLLETELNLHKSELQELINLISS